MTENFVVIYFCSKLEELGKWKSGFFSYLKQVLSKIIPKIKPFSIIANTFIVRHGNFWPKAHLGIKHPFEFAMLYLVYLTHYGIFFILAWHYFIILIPSRCKYYKFLSLVCTVSLNLRRYLLCIEKLKYNKYHILPTMTILFTYITYLLSLIGKKLLSIISIHVCMLQKLTFLLKKLWIIYKTDQWMMLMVDVCFQQMIVVRK